MQIASGLHNKTTINLSNCELEDKHVSALFEALDRAPRTENKITSIDLSKNAMTFFILSGFENLQKLDISSNCIRTLDLKLSSLTDLDARNNCIIDKLILHVPTLEKLDLGLSGIREINVTKHTKLKSVNLSHNYLRTLDLSYLKNLKVAKIDNNLIKDLFTAGSEIDKLLEYSSGPLGSIGIIDMAARHNKDNSKVTNISQYYGLVPVIDNVSLQIDELTAHIASMVRLYKHSVFNDLLLNVQKVYVYLAVWDKKAIHLPAALALSLDYFEEQLTEKLLRHVETILKSTHVAANIREQRLSLLAEFKTTVYPGIVKELREEVKANILKSTKLHTVISRILCTATVPVAAKKEQPRKPATLFSNVLKTVGRAHDFQKSDINRPASQPSCYKIK